MKYSQTYQYRPLNGNMKVVFNLLKPQDSFGEFKKKKLLIFRTVQEIIRKHHQIFLQLFWIRGADPGGQGAVTPHENIGGKHIVLPPPPNNFDNLNNS